MVVVVVLALVVATLLAVVYGGSALARRSLPPALLQAVAAPPWEKLDVDTFTQHRRPRPTLFFTPSGIVQHKLWIHYYDDDAPDFVPGLTVEACVAPASPSRATELPGLPDGLTGSIAFEVNEGERFVSAPTREEHIAKARDWLADAGPLAALPGSKLSIDPSHAGGFRIHVYWSGGADELALAVRVAEAVEARIAPQLTNRSRG